MPDPNESERIDDMAITRCPWCGSSQTVCCSAWEHDGWYVGCGDDKCDARGPVRISARNAIMEWNRIAGRIDAPTISCPWCHGVAVCVNRDGALWCDDCNAFVTGAPPRREPKPRPTQ